MTPDFTVTELEFFPNQMRMTDRLAAELGFLRVNRPTPSGQRSNTATRVIKDGLAEIFDDRAYSMDRVEDFIQRIIDVADEARRTTR